MRRTLLTLFGGLMLSETTLAADLKATVPPPSPAEITRLVSQLGDAEFKTREAAAKRLQEIGQPALAPLESAAKSDNPEVSERAEQLLVRIAQRLDNDKALAPAVVELPGDEQTVRAVFEAIEKQTRYKLPVAGDAAALNRKVKPTPGKRAFWEAVQEVCDAAGLEVAGVLPNPLSLASQERQLREAAARLDDATKKLRVGVLKKNRQECADEVQRLREATDKEKDAVKLKVLADQFAECDARLKGIDADLAAFDPQIVDLSELAHGIVTLRAKGGSGSRPWCEHGVRVEAEPPSADTLKRQAADVLAVQMRVTPEPRLRWNGVASVSVLKAVAADDREVRMHYPMPVEMGPEYAERQMILRQRRLIESRQGTATTPPVVPVAVAPLVAPPGAAVTKLKTVEGFFRGTVWTEPEEIVKVEDPEPGKTTAAVPVNGTGLAVRVSDQFRTNPDSGGWVEITLSFNPAEVRPEVDRMHTGSDLVLGQQNGRVQVINQGLQQADPNRVNTPDRPFGLTATDTDGKPLSLSQVSQSTYQQFVNQKLVTVCRINCQIRPTERGAAVKLGAIAFRGSRLAEVTVPFKLADVPVAAGTGDGRPLPEDGMYYKR